MFIDLRGTNIDVREERQSVASCKHPDWGMNLQPRCVPRNLSAPGTTLQTPKPPDQGGYL